jgi:hypothetical protein
MEWINMAQDTHKWRALVNMVVNVWVPQRKILEKMSDWWFP